MDERPGSLIGAVVVIFIQVVVNAAAGLFVVVDIFDRADHGRNVVAAIYVAGFGSLVGAVVLGVCAVQLLRRVNVARIPAAVLEGLVIVAGFVNVFMGAPQAFVGILLAVIVLSVLFSRRTGDWLSTGPVA